MKELIEEALAQPYFDTQYSQENQRKLDVQAPLQAKYDEKHPQVCVCTGENATGKSFFVNTIRYLARKEHTHIFHAGMVHRGASYASSFSEHYWSLPPEEIASTGENSTILMMQGLEGAKDIEKPHIILFDEPTLGLSSSYHNVVGKYIKSFVEQGADQLKGVIVVEHSISCLQSLLEVEPSHLRFGDEKTLDEVVHSQTQFTIDDLKALPFKSEETRRKIVNIKEKIEEYTNKK